MDFYILDQDFNDIDIVQNAESLVWKKCYCDPGSFEIYTIASAENINLLQIGRYVTRLDDDMIGVIEKINIQKDDDGRNMLLVSGRCAKSLFARRIIQPQQTFSGTVWNRMYWMIYHNAAEPSAEYRKIPGISISDVDPGIKGASDKTQHTGTNLMDAVIELLAANNLGWKITRSGLGLIVTLISGTDRSVSQFDNEPVVFADDLDNLISSGYEKNTTGYANVAHIAGEGEESARVWAGIDITGGQTGISGLDRYELFVDARDIQKTSTDDSGNETTMTDAEYYAQLQARGFEKLKDAQYTESFEGESDWGAYKYRVDYDVGDIVTIRTRFGISADIRIVAVEEIEDEDGYTVTPILADCTSIERNQSSGASGSGSSSGYVPSSSSGGGVDVQTLLESVYPVGAIYISTVSTSPATLFGFGSWTRILGRFLLGAGAGYTAGETGGEATHKLTTSEMPAHAHAMYVYNGGSSSTWSPSVGSYLVTAGSVSSSKNTHYAQLGMQNSGYGDAHNNMPPYYAVYIWRRTA